MHKILIANRGEIACRLILACREHGYATVAVVAEPDADAPHGWLADERLELPGKTPAETYLDAEKLIALARACGADAIHPGYGFLSEDAHFASRCREAGLCFIGPPAAAIATLGHKLNARRLVEAAGVPVLPGAVLAGESARRPEPGDFPVIVKAALGGGGMGLRRVETPDALDAAIEEARAQCAAAFAAKGGESTAESLTLYWESYLEGARHIEVQIAADRHGAVLALGERDCSIQRRFQKLIEECPAPGLSDAERERAFGWAVAAARAVQYENVGTVEFLYRPDRGFVFLEMNTRLQVEHPVTEWVGGIDIPGLQLAIAEGQALASLAWSPRGVALEARLYAEDPDTGVPAPGRIDHLQWPTGAWVRVDAGVSEGQTLSPYYDALLAKVIAWGPDRATAIRRLALALARTEIVGSLTTNLPRLRAVLAHPDFQAGRIDTQFLGREPLALPEAPVAELALASFLAEQAPTTAAATTPGSAHWARRAWRSEAR